MTDDGRARAARLLARSPFAMRRADALNHIEERRKSLLAQPLAPAPVHEPDFAAAEPMPVLDQPEQFAAEFWAARKLPGPKDKPPKSKRARPRGRRPRGELTADHDRFRVIDGDKQR